MKIPLLPLEERKTTFKEVELGFTQEQALAEANRCIQCQKPACVEGCPAQVNIPAFIKAFREGNADEAANIIRQRNFFPSICGRICQHEKQCEGNCVLGKTQEKNPVAIGTLERFVGDNASFPTPLKHLNGKKAAVIGSGPSGLSVAAHLALSGINVTVFEGTNSFGGVIKYGVPDFRLPKDTISRELTGLHDLSIDFEPNSKVGEESLEALSQKFDAIFVGTGVGKSRSLTVPGSDLKGIISAMKLLINLNQSGLPMITQGEKVVVVGAGYVGIDASRSAIRLGADVTCVTIANREDALKSVAEKDYLEAEEEGVKFLFGFKVQKFEGTERVEKVFYANGKEGVILADKVIYAVGQEHDADSLKTPLRTTNDGCIHVNEIYQTSIKNVFAAGDCVHGPKTVIHAINTGREAAKSMIAYLSIPEDQRKVSADEKEKIKQIGKHLGESFENQTNSDI